jgi:hypothetical protein
MMLLISLDLPSFAYLAGTFYRYVAPVTYNVAWSCDLSLYSATSLQKNPTYKGWPTVLGKTNCVLAGIRLQQDRQCTCKVTLRRVRETLLPWKINTYCVCVHVSGRVGVYMRVSACSLTYSACNL